MTMPTAPSGATSAARTRSAAERERMYQWLFETGRAGYRWPMYGSAQWQDIERIAFDRILTAAPQLWDSLPPDPVEVARAQAEREAEEDRKHVENCRLIAAQSRCDADKYWAANLVRIADRMTARAAAGYPVLGERKET